MESWQEMGSALRGALRLRHEPVAVALTDTPPDEAETFEGSVPAGCVFWQEGSRRAVTTSAADHSLCAIGVHTHNLAGAAPSHEGELTAALEAMEGLDYVRPDEVRALPTAAESRRHAVYAPLASAPLPPDVVLLFADGRQGLVISEAVARVDEGLPPALGRPACAVVPHALGSGRAAQSLGCCGARAYLDDLSDDVTLWALPGEKLEAYAREIGGLAAANETLRVFHERRREDVEGGARPTVRESLDRLQGN